MANKSVEPGRPEGAPIESGRMPPAGDGGVTPDETLVEDGESSVIDVPQMGEFSAEGARPTPLDDILEAERSRLPKD